MSNITILNRYVPFSQHTVYHGVCWLLNKAMGVMPNKPFTPKRNNLQKLPLIATSSKHRLIGA
jgi:hypothetical protein